VVHALVPAALAILLVLVWGRCAFARMSGVLSCWHVAQRGDLVQGSESAVAKKQRTY
jgi:hypothetical protein